MNADAMDIHNLRELFAPQPVMYDAISMDETEPIECKFVPWLPQPHDLEMTGASFVSLMHQSVPTMPRYIQTPSLRMMPARRCSQSVPLPPPSPSSAEYTSEEDTSDSDKLFNSADKREKRRMQVRRASRRRRYKLKREDDFLDYRLGVLHHDYEIFQRLFARYTRRGCSKL